MILLIFISFLFSGPGSELEYLREQYTKAAFTETANDELLKTLSRANVYSTEHLAYTGAGTILKARYCFNPYTKLQHFKVGKEILESAIARDTQNVETRFLRYTIQKNLPSILGYYQDIAKDEQFLLLKLPSVKDNHLRKYIQNFLMEQKVISHSYN